MGQTHVVEEFLLEQVNYIKIYDTVRYNHERVVGAQLVYKWHGAERVTENISLDWLYFIDSHSFYNWLEFKHAQKQRYNTQHYALVFKLILLSHPNR